MARLTKSQSPVGSTMDQLQPRVIHAALHIRRPGTTDWPWILPIFAKNIPTVA